MNPEVICLLCMTTCVPICSCGNVATIRDPDGDLHIYVEQIKTTRLANIYYLNGVETYRELLDPFDTALYVDYMPVKNSYLNFQPYTPKNNYVRRYHDKFDTRLINLLDKYKHTTASPNRIGSTKKQPKRKLHD